MKTYAIGGGPEGCHRVTWWTWVDMRSGVAGDEQHITSLPRGPEVKRG